MPNPIPVGHIIQLHKGGATSATISAFDSINKTYTLLDENGQPLPGTYPCSKWWNPRPPAKGGGAVASAPAPDRAAPPKTSDLPKQSLKEKRPLTSSNKTQPAKQMQPSKKAKAAPKKVPLARGTTVKLDKSGTATATVGDYDIVSKRYTLYSEGKLLPGSYERASFWDPA